MKKMLFGVCVVAVAASATFPVLAGSAEPDGTDFMVTAGAGESFTNSTAIGNYARLVKRGVGEVVLTAATTAFAGEVLVEEGTLAITDLKAVGASTPVTVEDGATFWIRTPHTGAQSAPLFNTHKITISGHGVDGGGALRYTQTSGSGLADNMFGHIVLAADATINAGSRWGMDVESYRLDLNGHTLTHKGGYTILYNTITAGTILHSTGTLTFQGTANFPDGTNTTFVITNSSTLAFWAQRADHPIQAAVRLNTGRTIRTDSGAANTISGPLHVAKHGSPTNGPTDAIIDLSTQYNNTALHLNGPLTSDKGLGYNYHCRLILNGGGTLWLNGPVDFEGNVYPRCGWLCMTSAVSRVFRNGVSLKNSRVWLADGTFSSGFLRVPNGGSASGLFRQTGGTLSNGSDAPRIGESDKSYGWYVLEGGTANLGSLILMGEHVGSYGVIRQKGGLMKSYRTDAGGTLYIGQKGEGLFIQTGGTNYSYVVTGGQDLRTIMNVTNGTSEATISGTGTVFRAEGFSMGWNLSLCTNILNISDGALFMANRFKRHEGVMPGSLSCVNADGGIMAPTFGWGWGAANAGTANFFPRSPDHFVLWDKGLVFDTSYTYIAQGSLAISQPSFWFEAPTGKGFDSISLPTDSAYVPANYYGVARVVFEDATGWGASAYAEYDYDTKRHTKIVITSRGCDYSDDAKVYLEGPDRKTRYACAFTLSDNAGHGGPLIKRGPTDLYLYATNTYTGGTIVEQGVLRAQSSWVLPSNSSVRVESGATLYLNNFNATLASFAGPGALTGGNVTVTNAVRASCADLFAGKHATFEKNLTFAPGATFTITDPENLEAYAHGASVAAFTAQTISGTPTLAFEGTPAGTAKWMLFKKNATTYNFGAVIGTAIFLK